MQQRAKWTLGVTLALGIGSAWVWATNGHTASPNSVDEDREIADSLATMLRSGRNVISRNQELINNPAIGDKGLTGKKVLEEAVKLYETAMQKEPGAIPQDTRLGKLLRIQMDAIAEVVDNNQATINHVGVGFKGFIPATFGRLVNETFNKNAAGEAEMKVTAPPELVRNRKARPDAWEVKVIQTKLLSPSWPKGQLYAASDTNKGRDAFRVAVPEYYGASCLSCHGGPKGQIDVTGYPKEGAAEGDLGGVISLTLYR
jgi:hypothetical protein